MISYKGESGENAPRIAHRGADSRRKVSVRCSKTSKNGAKKILNPDKDNQDDRDEQDAAADDEDTGDSGGVFDRRCRGHGRRSCTE